MLVETTSIVCLSHSVKSKQFIWNTFCRLTALNGRYNYKVSVWAETLQEVKIRGIEYNLYFSFPTWAFCIRCPMLIKLKFNRWVSVSKLIKHLFKTSDAVMLRLYAYFKSTLYMFATPAQKFSVLLPSMHENWNNTGEGSCNLSNFLMQMKLQTAVIVIYSQCISFYRRK